MQQPTKTVVVAVFSLLYTCTTEVTEVEDSRPILCWHKNMNTEPKHMPKIKACMKKASFDRGKCSSSS